MIKNNFAKILAIIISVHLLISVFLILFPSPVGVNKAIDLYRRYLLPGPFFSDRTITETHLLFFIQSGGEKGQSAVNPTLSHYNSFFSKWNPSQMYRTRLERSVYENIQIAVETGDESDLSFNMNDLLKYYVKEQAVPKNFDQTRMILLRKNAIDFHVTADTLQNAKF